YVEQFPGPGGEIPPLRFFRWIGPGYFETLGARVLAGRVITWEDVQRRMPVVVVSDNFAHSFFKTPSAALGKRVRQDPGSAWREIVGVVANVHDEGLDKAATEDMYWPMAQNDWWN